MKKNYLNRSSHNPIGIFDSGVGGLTVAAAINKALPNERILYYGDTAHFPYGNKSATTLCEYADNIVKRLISQQCKIIIFACNSVTAASFSYIKNKYQHKAIFLNVIEPNAKLIASQYTNKHVGIIGTTQTIKSNIYQSNIKFQNIKVELSLLATPLLAPAIEEQIATNILENIIENYLKELPIDKLSALLLGCTHYSIAKKSILNLLPSNVKIIDGLEQTVIATRDTLEKYNLLNTSIIGRHHFYVSDLTPEFTQNTQIFFGKKLILEQNS